jgi:hypothetical protein
LLQAAVEWVEEPRMQLVVLVVVLQVERVLIHLVEVVLEVPSFQEEMVGHLGVPDYLEAPVFLPKVLMVQRIIATIIHPEAAAGEDITVEVVVVPIVSHLHLMAAAAVAADQV